MLPVPGQLPPPGFGTGIAFALNFVIEAVISAEATAGMANAKRPRTARQTDALRIRFSLLYCWTSASIRVAPEPLPVRRHRDPRQRAGEQWRFLQQPYPPCVAAATAKARAGASLQQAARSCSMLRSDAASGRG